MFWDVPQSILKLQIIVIKKNKKKCFNCLHHTIFSSTLHSKLIEIKHKMKCCAPSSGEWGNNTSEKCWLIGTLPRNTDPVSLANSSPPPLEKMLLHSWKTHGSVQILIVWWHFPVQLYVFDTHRTVWTHKAAHVLHDAQDFHGCLLTKGDLAPHVSCRHRLPFEKGVNACYSAD